jgi:hypothetical protein
MNIPATVLIVSVICAPAACLASQFGDRPGMSVRPSIIFVDEDEYVIDLNPLPPNASFEECVRFTSDKCGEKYGLGGNEMCAIQYANFCTDRSAACQAADQTDCDGAQ